MGNCVIVTSRSTKSTKKGSQSSQGISVVQLGLLALYTILALVLIFMMLTYNILAVKGLNTLVFALLAVVFLVATLFIIWKKAKRIISTILIISCLLISVALYASKSLLDTSTKMNQVASYMEVEMQVLVPKNGAIKHLHQVTELTAPVATDSANIKALTEALLAEKQLEPKVVETASYLTAYHSLLEGKTPAMVLNSGYESFLMAEDPQYKDKVTVLHTYKIRKDLAPVKPLKGDTFNLYISGIDTYGPITSVSRSDVNIIMTVNRKTKQVLLTTTPRDSYVQIPDGGQNQYDKLTHAGIYGVDASIHTLENLYGIDIHYYARINFTSFLTLIDLLGGIEVENTQAFRNGEGDFPVGTIQLDSKRALAFVRERYQLENGDRDRGKNQEKVIAAIIKNLTTVQALTNYQGIIEGLGDAIQTDMPFETLMSLANSQLASGDAYQVISQAVEGTGSTGELPSFAMPHAKLYMFSIDQASLEQAKSAIRAVEEGRK